jgi:hypothetical protein
MPTIASSAPPQRLPPGDTDLQELYDQVLSAFAEESSPSNFSPTFSIGRSNNVDPDSLYSLHSDEGEVSSRPRPQSRRQSLPLLLLSLLISLPPPFSIRQPESSRQQPSTSLPNNSFDFSRPGPPPTTKASCSVTSSYPAQMHHMPESSIVQDPLASTGAKPEQCVTL